MHELASTTTGSWPSPVHRHRPSIRWFAIQEWPSRYPLEAQGVPQQWPATPGGIQTGSPARSDTATSASGRLGGDPLPSARCGEAPKILLMQAGR